MKFANYFISLLTVLFFSCQSKLSKEDKYELETYKLINEGFFNSRDYLFEKNELYILEKPKNLFKTEDPRKHKYLRNSFKSEFSVFGKDSSYFKNWDKNRITKDIKYIYNDSLIEINRITTFFNNLTDETKIKLIDSIDVKVKNLWKTKNIHEYTELTLPHFNKDYTKAVLFYLVKTNPNEMNGCMVSIFDFYLKKNEKWIIADYEETEKLVEQFTNHI